MDPRPTHYSVVSSSYTLCARGSNVVSLRSDRCGTWGSSFRNRPRVLEGRDTRSRVWQGMGSICKDDYSQHCHTSVAPQVIDLRVRCIVFEESQCGSQIHCDRERSRGSGIGNRPERKTCLQSNPDSKTCKRLEQGSLHSRCTTRNFRVWIRTHPTQADGIDARARRNREIGGR